MEIEHFEDVAVGSAEDLLIWPHLHCLSYQGVGQLKSLQTAVFAENDALCLAEVELRNTVRKCKAVIDDLLGQFVVVQVDVGCSHVQVNLNQQRFSHVDVSSLSELLPVPLPHVIVVVSDEELLVLLPQLTEGISRLLLLLPQRNLNL